MELIFLIPALCFWADVVEPVPMLPLPVVVIIFSLQPSATRTVGVVSDSLLVLPLLVLLLIVDSKVMEALLEIGLLLWADRAEVSWAIDGAGFNIDCDSMETKELKLCSLLPVPSDFFEVTKSLRLWLRGMLGGPEGLELARGGRVGVVGFVVLAVTEGDDGELFLIEFERVSGSRNSSGS